MQYVIFLSVGQSLADTVVFNFCDKLMVRCLNFFMQFYFHYWRNKQKILYNRIIFILLQYLNNKKASNSIIFRDPSKRFPFQRVQKVSRTHDTILKSFEISSLVEKSVSMSWQQPPPGQGYPPQPGYPPPQGQPQPGYPPQNQSMQRHQHLLTLLVL